MLERIELAAEIGSWHEARRRFVLFRKDLEEHMRLEEEVMFPAFDAASETREGPSNVMRVEHGEIRQSMEEIECLLSEEQSIGDAVLALEALFSAHNIKEEQDLYPLFARIASPETAERFRAEIRELVGSE
jgi:iron-sulfur cluster repair protein YtfE (RIC family)